MVLVLIVAMILAMIALPYYRLALRFDKSTWKYGLFGILVFFSPTIVLVFLSGVYVYWKYDGDVVLKPVGSSEVLFLLGVIVSYFYYRHLKRKWINVPKEVEYEDILDQ